MAGATDITAECLGWRTIGSVIVDGEHRLVRECAWRFTHINGRHCGLTFANPKYDPADPEASYQAHATQLARDLDVLLDEAAAVLKGLEWPEDGAA